MSIVSSLFGWYNQGVKVYWKPLDAVLGLFCVQVYLSILVNHKYTKSIVKRWKQLCLNVNILNPRNQESAKTALTARSGIVLNAKSRKSSRRTMRIRRNLRCSIRWCDQIEVFDSEKMRRWEGDLNGKKQMASSRRETHTCWKMVQRWPHWGTDIQEPWD